MPSPHRFCAALLAVAATAAAAATGDAAAPAQVQIPFASHHGIYDWRVVNDRTVLIESQSFQWYKATLMSACIDLPFAETIGFETNPDGSFDKFSAITVRHQRCPLISLTPTSAPKKSDAKSGAGHAAGAQPAG